MATFTGRTPSNTYKNLLNVDNSNSGVDATLRSIQDGEGTTMLWSVSTTAMTYTGAASFSNMTITGGSVTGITDLALADGGTNASLTASNGGIFYSTATAGAILSGTATANKMLLSGSSAAPTWSTSTIPSSAGATAGKILVSDGTNYILSTPTFPNSSATSGKLIVSDGTNWITSTPTFPNASATSGKLIISDGTNWIASTPTYPNAASTSGKILQSDGTNFVTSTNTLTLSSSTTLNGGTHSGTNTGDQSPGGSNTYVQFNDSSTFGGDSGLTYNKTTDVLTATGGFRGTNQPGFLAYRTSDATNVTGDNTVYTFVGTTEVFDNGGGHNTSTGVFTVPSGAGGLYYVYAQFEISGLSASFTDGTFYFVHNSVNVYSCFRGNPGVQRDTSNIFRLPCCALISMAAGDTVDFRLVVNGSTKTITVVSGLNATKFGAVLIA